MKRWAIVTVGLYSLLLLVLTLPLIQIATIEYSKEAHEWSLKVSLAEAAEVFGEWGYWVWFAILLICQALLLLVPVDLTRQKLPSRRKLRVPIVVGSMLLANLFGSGILCILVAFWGDNASKVFEGPAEVTETVVRRIGPIDSALNGMGFPLGSGLFPILIGIGLTITLWILWGVIFFHYAKNDPPEGATRRAVRWLIRASILELLIAIPSHVMVRHRNDCCATLVSFWGIVSGISIMFMAFGPGVLFLFARRVRAKQSARAIQRPN